MRVKFREECCLIRGNVAEIPEEQPSHKADIALFSPSLPLPKNEGLKKGGDAEAGTS